MLASGPNFLFEVHCIFVCWKQPPNSLYAFSQKQKHNNLKLQPCLSSSKTWLPFWIPLSPMTALGGNLFPPRQAWALFVEFALTLLTPPFGLSVNPGTFSWLMSPLFRLLAVSCTVHLGTNCRPLLSMLATPNNVESIGQEQQEVCDVLVERDVES